MKLNQSIIGIILASSLMACGTKDGSQEYYEESTEEDGARSATSYEFEAEDLKQEASSMNDVTTSANAKISTQMLIKTGNIGFECKDVYATRIKVNLLIKQFGGYISNESEDYYGNRINQYLTIRIPNKNFESFIDATCDGVDKFDNKNINVQDVTEEFVDTETRIANKKALEQKYITLLEKAHTIEDILEIEKEINYLRQDIELAEAHLKSLSAQVSYSTLDLYIYQNTSEVTHKKDPDNRFVKGLKNGWDNVVDFFVGLTYAWPGLLIFGTIFYFARRAWKRSWKDKLMGKD